MQNIKSGNRSRRLSAKLREILLGIKNREAQIEAVQANEELGAPDKETLVAKMRNQIGADRVAANRLEKRKRELAYEDRSPVSAAPRGAAICIPSHASVIQESGPAKWTRISRREWCAARSFFAVRDAFSTVHEAFYAR
jgi:hypothetical protein